MLTFKAIKCIFKKFKLTCSTQRYCSYSGTNFSGTFKNWLPWRILTYSEDVEAAAAAVVEGVDDLLAVLLLVEQLVGLLPELYQTAGRPRRYSQARGRLPPSPSWLRSLPGTIFGSSSVDLCAADPSGTAFGSSSASGASSMDLQAQDKFSFILTSLCTPCLDRSGRSDPVWHYGHLTLLLRQRLCYCDSGCELEVASFSLHLFLS